MKVFCIAKQSYIPMKFTAILFTMWCPVLLNYVYAGDTLRINLRQA